jgi:hypothetical protein
LRKRSGCSGVLDIKNRLAVTKLMFRVLQLSLGDSRRISAGRR